MNDELRSARAGDCLRTWFQSNLVKAPEHRRIFLPQLVSCQMLIIGNPADVSGVVRHPTRFRTYQLMAARCGGRPPRSCHPRALYQRCWFHKHLPTPVVAGTTEAVYDS
jgi:hypothetical protein